MGTRAVLASWGLPIFLLLSPVLSFEQLVKLKGGKTVEFKVLP